MNLAVRRFPEYARVHRFVLSDQRVRHAGVDHARSNAVVKARDDRANFIEVPHPRSCAAPETIYVFSA